MAGQMALMCPAMRAAVMSDTRLWERVAKENWSVNSALLPYYRQHFPLRGDPEALRPSWQPVPEFNPLLNT